MITAPDLAARLGLRRSGQRRQWSGDCPACGYRSSLIVSEKEERVCWWCAACCDKHSVTKAVFQAMGQTGGSFRLRPATVKETSASSQKTAIAQALWNSALPLPGTIAETYLHARGLPELRSSTALRYLPDALHPSGTRWPAMLAAIRNAITGNLQAAHRTYLRHDGSGKADIAQPRASLGPTAGGVIMLAPIEDGDQLIVGEGIETTASAAAMVGGAPWAAISCGNLAALQLPDLPACSVVVIAADADKPGEESAYAAAMRWRGEGRSVRIATPDTSNLDFNDLLRARIAMREANNG